MYAFSLKQKYKIAIRDWVFWLLQHVKTLPERPANPNFAIYIATSLNLVGLSANDN